MPAPDPIAGYGLTRPTVGDALVAVHRAHGADAATIWAQLLTAAKLAGHEDDDAALARLIEAMAGQDPVSRVLARSLLVRLTTYKHLAAAQRHLSATER